VKVLDEIEKTVKFLEEDPFISSIEVLEGNNEITFVYKGSAEEQMKLLRKAVSAGLSIYAFMEEQKDLEDVYMAITKGADAK